jgi:hypothetical protein
MQRLNAEIFYNNTTGRIWVAILVQGEDEVFSLYTHYGHTSDARFRKKLKYTTEHVELGTQIFNQTVAKKSKEKGFVSANNGTAFYSAGLLAVFRDTPSKPQKTQKLPEAQPPTTRKLRL